MTILFEQLKPKERRGSKPRCHLLTHGSPVDVAARLTALAAPFASVSPRDRWMPKGFEHTAEAMLPEAARLLPPDVRLELKRWWLAVTGGSAKTPNWDVASTCTVEGGAGILLVEGKAHIEELRKEEAGKKLSDTASPNSCRNHEQIGAVINAASAALTVSTGLQWTLSRDSHYQMANRFAWSWKLTDLGFPVVLVYLGFVNASEMCDISASFRDEADWRDAVKDHSKTLFPAEVWNRRWTSSGQAFIPLIRTIERPLADEAVL